MMKHIVARQIACVLILLAPAMVGCQRGLDVVAADGVVTYEGKPVEAAAVGFIRQGQPGPAAIAFTDARGRFTLTTGKYEGAPPGKYAVTVQKDTTWNLKIPDPLPEGMGTGDYLRAHNIIPKPLLPAKYSMPDKTPLHYEVSADAGKNHFELKLEGAVN
jgi:hypothetical protein